MGLARTIEAAALAGFIAASCGSQADSPRTATSTNQTGKEASATKDPRIEYIGTAMGQAFTLRLVQQGELISASGRVQILSMQRQDGVIKLTIKNTENRGLWNSGYSQKIVEIKNVTIAIANSLPITAADNENKSSNVVGEYSYIWRQAPLTSSPQSAPGFTEWMNGIDRYACTVKPAEKKADCKNLNDPTGNYFNYPMGGGLSDIVFSDPRPRR